MYISSQLSVYATQSGSTAFSAPTNTVATVTCPSDNLMAAVISETSRAHEENIRIWKEYANLMWAAKKVIFDHVPDTCYRTLKKKYTGYVNSTYLNIYNNLIEEYRELSDDIIQENIKLMKREITGETHFEDLVQQILSCVKNVASRNPYNPTQTVSVGFNVIYKCGFCSYNCQDWRRKDNPEKPCLTLNFTLQGPSKIQETQTRPP